MMDCPFRSSTDPPRRGPAAIVAAMLVAACAGCATSSNGKWFSAGSFRMFVDNQAGCECCQHHHGSGCGACDEPPWPADECADWQDDWSAPDDGDGFSPLALDDYASESCGSTCDGGSCRGLRRRWYEPEAGIFNFCIPPGTIGPPPPPPPGRFHPVPTRPVFAPQPSVAVITPHGQ